MIITTMLFGFMMMMMMAAAIFFSVYESTKKLAGDLAKDPSTAPLVHMGAASIGEVVRKRRTLLLIYDDGGGGGSSSSSSSSSSSYSQGKWIRMPSLVRRRESGWMDAVITLVVEVVVVTNET